MAMSRRHLLSVAWILSVAGAVGVRAWNAIFGPLFYGYDAWGHVAYVFFIDLYRALPFADQGWSYFHPPLHYLLGWLLMQAGDSKTLIVGLALVSSAASLGVAALGAFVVQRAFPGRSALSLLAFSALAFLPVHLYTSAMPGNELTAAFLGAAAVGAHLRNETRAQPTLAGDLATGVLCGLAMLSKFTALIPCLAIGAFAMIRWLRSGSIAAGAPRLALRAAAILVPLLFVAGPWYARNVAEFGTPFETSAETNDVARIQAEQFPGERGVLDFVRISPKLFENSTGDAPHMVRSVWSNTYLNIWFDTYREGQLPLPGFPIWHPFVHQLTIFFGMLGLIPTGVAFIGAFAAARTVRRDEDAVVPLAMLVLAAGSIAAFVLFTIRIPTWAALKASYLLNLSLPFAYFVACGTAVLTRRDKLLGSVAPIGITLIAIAGTATFTTGALMRRHFDSHQMVSVDAHFGQFDSTRAIFRPDAPARSYLEARAAVELLDGNPTLARRFYLHADRMPLADPKEQPYWTNRLAVATALAGDLRLGKKLLDEELEKDTIPELLVNRAALQIFLGDGVAGEEDARAAIERDPSLPPAWRNLATALALRGAHDDAARALARANIEEEIPPRGFPYGVGNGYLYDSGAGQRWMLVLSLTPGDDVSSEELALYRPRRARNHSPRETRLKKSIDALVAAPVP